MRNIKSEKSMHTFDNVSFPNGKVAMGSSEIILLFGCVLIPVGGGRGAEEQSRKRDREKAGVFK